MNKAIHIYRTIVIVVYFLLICIGAYYIQGIAKDYVDDYMLYMTFISLSLSLLWLAQNSASAKLSYVLVFCSWLSLTILMASRDMTAIDDLSYYTKFMSVDNQSLMSYVNAQGTELGFDLFTYVSYHIFSGNYYAYQVVCSSFPMVIYYYSIWSLRDQLNCTLALLLFISMIYAPALGSGLVRLFIAIAIMSINYKNLINNKWRRYIIITILTSFIHMSALFLLVFCVLWFKKARFESWIKDSLALCVPVPFALLIVRFLIAPNLGRKYAIYLKDVNLEISIGQFDKVLFIVIALISIRWAKKHFDKESNKLYNLYITMVLLGVTVSICTGIIEVGRLEYYLRFGVIYLLSMMIKKIHCNELGSVVITVVVMAYAMLYMYIGCVLEETRFIHMFPYQSFWW